MPFSIVQTRKNKRARPTMTIVPNTWVKHNSVYWPMSNLLTLSADENSEPDMASWSLQKCKVVGRGSTYADAENVMRILEAVTDSEDTVEISRGTRATPGTKKPKFNSKVYQLAPAKHQLQTHVETTFSSSSSGQNFSSVNSMKSLSKSPAHIKSQPETSNNSTNIRPLPSAAGNVPISTISGPSQQNFAGEATLNQMMIRPLIVQSGDGKQYLQLQNGTYRLLSEFDEEIENLNTNGEQENLGFVQQVNPAPVSAANAKNFPTITEESNDSYLNGNIESYPVVYDDETPSDEMGDIQSDEMAERLDRIEKNLNKILFFMADIEKYFKMKQQESKTHEEKQPKQKRSTEDFSEFKAILPIKTVQDLMSIESKLEIQSFSEKLYQYFEVMYNLNGKREGHSFFRNLIRKMIDISVLMPFSWLGNTRSKNGEPPVEQNRNFKRTFPRLINFIGSVLRAADFEYTIEDTEKAFSDFLRHKNTEMKRHINQGGQRRVSHTRKKRRLTDIPSDMADRDDYNDAGLDSISENYEEV
ncbi:uncharacterized protein LOC135702108 [Ochlerotatus camptorhynchus]|uniref:uncharacterized protein LOC135702108 n=1 Tax=Ochlerotatus camptorhynchus TaxID=644619 RepID=UPI0031D20C15